MSNHRELKNGEKAEELEKSVQLIIKTKCPTKWIIEDLETGQRYRANGTTEIGTMSTRATSPSRQQGGNTSAPRADKNRNSYIRN